jgi:hypothetical protein
MTRRVSFRKAVLAGASGAMAWEVVTRVLVLSGVPVMDPARLLGTMAFPHSGFALWWPIGVLFHCGVGAIWAIFYAYFFWSEFPWRPVVQGLVFSLIPTILSGGAMLRQIMLMHPLYEHEPGPRFVAFHMGLAGLLSLIFGHALYGAIVGTLYTHPVGYPIKKRKRLAHG